jgi:molybdopterin/thiamine biosynthesis adenylyltransferase/rhodanese-related sulfurtransferase/molybdopterin converting factor small subunit
LRKYSGEQAEVELEATTVGEALEKLTTAHAQLKAHLYDAQGKLRSYVNVYLGDEDVRYLQKEATPLKDGDELMIIPSIAGGNLTKEERTRYDRHLILPEVGEKGQEKLKAAKVLLIGTGGLGSPLALYLAAAGVGRLGVVDFDVVDASNLQRQIIHGQKDIGRLKIESARDRLKDINPLVQVDLFETALRADNALDILKDYDVVVDGTDNFPTRYLVNDACVLLKKPNVYGSIFRFEGQVSVFDPSFSPGGTEGGDLRLGGDYPCYRCLYPEPPPPGLVPSCAEGGVLGILPGVIGCLQATETIKLIVGIGRPLRGRLLLFDALEMKFRELKLRKSPDCPICGPHPSITGLIDYEEFCGLKSQAPELTPREFHEQWESGKRPVLVDVREQDEWDDSNLAEFGAKLIPLGQIPSRLEEIPRDQDVVVHCKSGGRSSQAQQLLIANGYTRVRNLTGGITRWAKDLDPSKA